MSSSKTDLRPFFAAACSASAISSANHCRLPAAESMHPKTAYAPGTAWHIVAKRPCESTA